MPGLIPWTYTTVDGTVHVVKSFSLSVVGGTLSAAVTFCCGGSATTATPLFTARSYKTVRQDAHRCTGCLSGLDLMACGF